jgi:AraC-like DNA-binding protein
MLERLSYPDDPEYRRAQSNRPWLLDGLLKVDRLEFSRPFRRPNAEYRELFVGANIGGSARLTFVSDDREYPDWYTTGGIVVAPPGRSIVWGLDDPADAIGVLISPQFLENIGHGSLRGKEIAAELIGGDRNDSHILNMLKLLDEESRKIRCNDRLLEKQTEALVEYLFDRFARKTPASDDDFGHVSEKSIKRVLIHIDENLCKPHALMGEELVRVAGMKRYDDFCRAFHRAMRMPPRTYVNGKRLELAKKLLVADSACTKRRRFSDQLRLVKDVAQHMGFEEYYFHRWFHKLAGMTATEFRERTP